MPHIELGHRRYAMPTIYTHTHTNMHATFAPHLMVATMTVLLLPPRLSLSSQVRVESRYGTKLVDFLLLLLMSARVEITSPSVVNDLFMLLPSAKRAPLAPVLPARSLPARSTRLILLTFSPVLDEMVS